MSSTPSGELSPIERLFVALLGGEPDKVPPLLHPQAEWSPTLWSGGEVYRGHEGVRRWLAQFGPALERLDHRIEKVRIDGDRGAVQGTVFDSRDGGMFAVRVVWSFELEDGLLLRGRAHETWDEATRAVGLA